MRRPAAGIAMFAAFLAASAATGAHANAIAEAEAAFADNRDAQAIELYTKAIGETAADPAAQAQAYFGRGEVHAAAGRADPAIADFTAALALQQDTAARANTLFSRAESETRKRAYQAAVDDYEAAGKLSPSMLGVHFGRGRALRLLNRKDEAAAEFDAELKLNPDSFRTQSARADLLGLPQPKDEYSLRRMKAGN